MVSINAFGKIVVEPKTLGWGTLNRDFTKGFEKPWNSALFHWNAFGKNMSWKME
jgi:hypothetical protein